MAGQIQLKPWQWIVIAILIFLGLIILGIILRSGAETGANYLESLTNQ